MARADLKGKVQTVLGPIEPEALGVTMPHEHLFFDSRSRFIEPAEESERALAHQPVTLKNLSWVIKHWVNNLDNLVLDDEQLATEEALLFKKAGGGTIVDVTNIGAPRNPLALRRISRATGLNIIMGTSYYFAAFHPEDMDSRTEDQITEEIVEDITQGVGDTGVRAGIMGEVGCSWPLHPNERKVLRASARAQRKTGAAISIHPGFGQESPFEILPILEEAGADMSRVIMGHVERAAFDMDGLMRLAQTGCYLEYDWFGQVTPTYPIGPVDIPSDSERINQIRHLIAEGYGKRILVSHDVCFKMRLASYGGPGYAHILTTVTTWMREKGIASEDIHALLVENPGRVLQLV